MERVVNTTRAVVALNNPTLDIRQLLVRHKGGVIAPAGRCGVITTILMPVVLLVDVKRTTKWLVRVMSGSRDG